MKIGRGVQAIPTFFFRNLRGCNVGITGESSAFVKSMKFGASFSGGKKNLKESEVSICM
jgi:hypothetical protein